ncbi:multidrug efflux pump [Hasllibacter halocynthiae]|uniref:Multidrug efflux pump n=1 Tax=Hasllibacter halocynthiae TaxID=595589 RepID=A0A2T0X919_9RHOB|nr:efflux RND transporter permease subunit [Hasllibacter halocynthiae]PRY95419.1 multidrug efflux pump [Hasllibacter halocynthiae]
MTGMVDWAASRARMVLAFIALSLLVGGFAYAALPKEGEPDIEIPAVVISLPFPGISAEDAEELLIRPMEQELGEIDGLDTMTSTAAEGYANIVLEFEFGWDKTAVLADVRDAMQKAEADFPDGFEQYTIDEFNFSEFPIVIVSLSGAVPEREMLRLAEDLQERLEGLDAVLEAPLAGHREEMVEVVIDPLRLESYNVTAAELVAVVQNNNALVAVGALDGPSGSNALKIDSAFDGVEDIYDLPVSTNGDRTVTMGDLADIRLTFEDREGTARFDGDTTVAVQVVKRKGFNLIDTVALIREEVAAEVAGWPEELRDALTVSVSNDQSRQVRSMVAQLEGSVLTAIALVMIVVLASLGPRSALLVGFAIPTSFLLCFAFLAVMGVSISNIVMFGLILAVGMLVDGAIVVVEYADKRLKEGAGPMQAYTDAAKRMFWPIVSSTATTLCAFLPMLFWPGVPGEFMGMLPVTLIFVLSASLVVALIYLPVMGGVAGRLSRVFDRGATFLRGVLPWIVRAALVPVALYGVFVGAMSILNPSYVLGALAPGGIAGVAVGGALFCAASAAAAVVLGSARIERAPRRIRAGHRRTVFGAFIKGIAGNPVMPVVTVGVVIFFVVSVFGYFGENNNGVEFFVESEPEQAIVYVQARGNLSLEEQDDLLRQVEGVVLAEEGVDSAFAFAGAGGLNANTGGAGGPLDAVGQVQIELVPWEDRAAFAASGETELTLEELDGDRVLARLEGELARIPGIRFEVLNLAQGPASAKPIHLRLMGEDLGVLEEAADIVSARFAATPGVVRLEDTTPLPGIDWQIDVDVEEAGRFGADVQTVGAMVSLVTRGLFLDTMRVPSSDEEIEIRVRLPEEDRLLSTLDTLKVRTPEGLVPLANFVTYRPVPQLGLITRVDEARYYDVKADAADGLSIVKVVPAAGPGDAEAPPPVDVGFGTELTEEEALARGGADWALAVPGGGGLLGGGGPDVRYFAFDEVTIPGGLGAAADLLGEPADLAVALPEGLPVGAVSAVEPADGTDVEAVVVNPNERIAVLTDWLETDPLPAGVTWEWTGDQEDQAESQAFLSSAFAAALGLMFIILLAQFNSVYNAVLVLLAVVLSTAGVLIGMLVMDQAFSIIMTGTGIVALAGIVVNNNIVLIDTYQDYSRYMPRVEAIVRTAEDRIRPVLLTTITTMAGLAPMMFGLSLDFIGGGYSVDSPTALWWKQLATAVVFGLGVATVLTLVFTPAMLALRVWASAYAVGIGRLIARLGGGAAARDWALRRAARRVPKGQEIVWDWGDEAAPAAAEPELPFDPPPVTGPDDRVMPLAVVGDDSSRRQDYPRPLRAAE